MKTSFVVFIFFNLLFSATGTANSSTIFYQSRAEFMGNVSASITDDYTGYVTGVYTDAGMSAVLGETTYEAVTFPNRNQVGNIFSYGDGSNYYSGCNGNFKLGFGSTSFSESGGVFGVGLDIVLHTSRRVSIGDDDPSNPTFEGSVAIQFTDGSTQGILIPADIGYYERSIYFLGISDDRGIASITIGTEPLASRHSWIIDNLTVASSAVPIPPAVWLFGSGLLGLIGIARQKKAA